MNIEIIQKKSPNFDERPKGTKINSIIIHYTGMKTFEEAYKKLCDKSSKVSSHYLIGRDGRIINLVNEKYRAWHAGVSRWKGIDNLNNNSIGIELENPGHEFGYISFSKKQMNALILLCKEIKKRYDIKAEWVLGHSDISPGRKLDPGEKFDWKTIRKIFK
jgi:N-acetylmuramoyl-L-alanine amidase